MSLPMNYRTRYKWSGDSVLGTATMGEQDSVRVGGPHGEDNLDPEHMFVAAAEICLANTFFFFAERARLRVVSYASEAEGELEKAPEGGFQFKEIVIRPKIEVDGDQARAEQAIDRAHRYCLVSRSMSCPVRVEHELVMTS
jgi:organic hydroperoxide reductase OsmC/OhrA